jgi:hypothetical protein
MAKAKWAQGAYQILNTAKYVGRGTPRYRSGWELSFMRFCDTNENILQWASESIQIPYRHPLTGKQTIYVPDFLVVYRTKNSTVKAEVIEIKPEGQSMITEKQSGKERAIVAINYAKWAAANVWCQRQGLTFRVITEKDMFHNGRA